MSVIEALAIFSPLLLGHDQRVQALRAADPAAQLLTVGTMQENIALCRRHSTIVSDHRRARGLLTREEMLSFATRIDQERAARAIWEEFQRLAPRPPST